ncbi:LexA family transcriptional regulator [uncultured Rikenella sp.]|uniref:LexA family transcriptional regulator n=1 Tax=uncultured Rikenella sp. TaxID=368003 RepID=UPI0026106357|nr:LexA family transcriptional regulator [uncultured Rikenella sp.]
MKTETDKRFIDFSEDLKKEGIISTYKAFCESVSISQQVYNDIKAGRRSVTIDIVINTCNTYNVSADYFLLNRNFSDSKTPKFVRVSNPNENTNKNPNKPKLQNSLGFVEGEIFKTKTPKNVINENDNKLDNIFDNKRKLQKTLSITPATYDLPKRSFVEVPVVDIDAAAGGGAINSDYTDETDQLRLPTSILPDTSSTRRCINVAGESMEPTLFDGTHIVIRLLNRAEWAQIRSGSVYVVTNREGETFIKRVRNKLRLQGVLVLISDNPDQRRYKPFEMTEEEIFNVWAVELMISDNIPPSDREIDDLRDQISDLRMLVERLVVRED